MEVTVGKLRSQKKNRVYKSKRKQMFLLTIHVLWNTLLHVRHG